MAPVSTERTPWFEVISIFCSNSYVVNFVSCLVVGVTSLLELLGEDSLHPAVLEGKTCGRRVGCGMGNADNRR